MRPLPAVLIASGTGCELFACWGLATHGGRAAFDEMAGMIPLSAAPVGVFLLGVAAALCWRDRRGPARRQ